MSSETEFSFRLLDGEKSSWQSQLLQSRKLILFIDLDFTIIQSVRSSNERHCLPLKQPKCQDRAVYYRPYLQNFLKELEPYYEFVITTAAAQSYATHYSKVIDPNQRYFKNRILSRGALSSLQASKVEFYKYVEPVDKSFICIIDDAPLVWGGGCKNVIEVLPFKATDPRPNHKYLDWVKVHQDGEKNSIQYLELLEGNLIMLHHICYSNYNFNGYFSPNVGNVLSTMHANILKGVVVLFDVVSLKKTTIKVCEIMARQMGATVVTQPEGITHIVTKSQYMIGCNVFREVKFVQPTWITRSKWFLGRQDERSYKIPPMKRAFSLRRLCLSFF